MASKHLSTAFRALFVLSSLTLTGAVVVSNTLPGSWVSQGCYVDVGRTLTGPEYVNATTMTEEACITYCSNNGYIYAGTEYSNECFCGNSIASTATTAPAPDCSMACAGNSTEACGGPNRLNLFWSGTTGPQTNPGSGLWSFFGCYNEGSTGRALPNAVSTTGGSSVMTIDLCLAACQEAGYTLAGAEYASQCWCGNQIVNGGTLTVTSSCSQLCNGNFSEFCGGPNLLDVYNFNSTGTSPTVTSSTVTATTTASPSSVPTVGPYFYYGCQTEGNNTRALAAKSTAIDTMTIEYCESFCLGYTYFGTEYGRECYCGNSFGQGSVPAPNSDCNFLCSGNPSELCGASDRLSVYKTNVTVTTTTTSSTPTFTPTLPTGWTYQGCWVDGLNGRILANQIPDSSNNTIELCISTCSGNGYTLAGVEYGAQCFCDVQIENGGALAANQGDCFMPCSGNAQEVCGAGDRLSLYSGVGTPPVAPESG